MNLCFATPGIEKRFKRFGISRLHVQFTCCGYNSSQIFVTQSSADVNAVCDSADTVQNAGNIAANDKLDVVRRALPPTHP